MAISFFKLDPCVTVPRCRSDVGIDPTSPILCGTPAVAQVIDMSKRGTNQYCSYACADHRAMLEAFEW